MQSHLTVTTKVQEAEEKIYLTNLHRATEDRLRVNPALRSPAEKALHHAEKVDRPEAIASLHRREVQIPAQATQLRADNLHLLNHREALHQAAVPHLQEVVIHRLRVAPDLLPQKDPAVEEADNNEN